MGLEKRQGNRPGKCCMTEVRDDCGSELGGGEAGGGKGCIRDIFWT